MENSGNATKTAPTITDNKIYKGLFLTKNNVLVSGKFEKNNRLESYQKRGGYS